MTQMSEIRAKLPKDFIEKMEGLLGEEYTDFISSYEEARHYALRYNPLKLSRDEFIKNMPFELSPAAWTDEGFYYNMDDGSVQPGKHALHEAGAYYIQEPSAMAVAEALAPEGGERILDLCAAPGGKSTHIAGKMMGSGLLVSNEIIPERAKVLSQNIERMGIANAVVCNETPERLAGFFPSFFDRILVDAPCSGEGMFRKDETAIEMWSLENVKMCASRQLTILEHAADMLKPGGVLVYSTCTFSPEENEGVISEFIKKHPGFRVEEAACGKFFEQGRDAWIEAPVDGIKNAMRLWPHKIAGEGHFIARLKKAGELYTTASDAVKNQTRKSKKADMDDIGLCKSFLEKELGLSAEFMEELEHGGRFTVFGEQIYLIPAWMIPLQGIKVIRPGLHLGTIKKNRLEPSHALALHLTTEDTKNRMEMTDEQTAKYLMGETFYCDEKLKGWMLLTTKGCSIGFGKAANGQMKNHYPKGLRKKINI